MTNAINVRKYVSVILAAFVLCASVDADIPQSVRLKRARVIQDKKAKTQRILVEFEITSEFVLAEARLFHRPRGSLEYSNVGLKQDHKLFYVATIPFAEEVEYYVELRPERGPVWFEGSPSDPRLLSSSDLHRVAAKKNRISRKAVVVVTVVVAIVLAVIFGIAKGKKDR